MRARFIFPADFDRSGCVNSSEHPSSDRAAADSSATGGSPSRRSDSDSTVVRATLDEYCIGCHNYTTQDVPRTAREP